MDYEFFETLTVDEARALLRRFCETESHAIQEMRPIAACDEVDLDYSIDTLPAALNWMIKRVRTIRVPVSEDEPWWIREAHADGLVEFDEDTKPIVLRAGYYLGECFARLAGKRWGIGDAEYLGKNMPVVQGFPCHEELPPLVVVENLFARILSDGGPASAIDTTVNVWLQLIADAA